MLIHFHQATTIKTTYNLYLSPTLHQLIAPQLVFQRNCNFKKTPIHLFWLPPVDRNQPGTTVNAHTHTVPRENFIYYIPVDQMTHRP